MKSVYLILGLVLFIHTANGWWLQASFEGGHFFDNFDFFNADDPTHGYVNYVDAGTAWNRGYVRIDNNVAIISPNTQDAADGRGRDAVRLHSKMRVSSGSIVIADVAHMPTGCGTWPAFWMCGDNWPHQGEIDIVEGVNNQNFNQMTLHTDGGCQMDPGQAWQFSGHWASNIAGGPSSNCDVNAAGQYANAGCGIIGAQDSYGDGFNKNGGGVFATVWTDSEISIYHFPRWAIPGDIQSQNPNPAGWGQPMAKFQIGDNCPGSHFGPQQIIINLTFCGDWAGGVFGQMCGGLGNCNDYVRWNPGAFNEAFWAFNSIKIYRA